MASSTHPTMNNQIIQVVYDPTLKKPLSNVLYQHQPNIYFFNLQFPHQSHEPCQYVGFSKGRARRHFQIDAFWALTMDSKFTQRKKSVAFNKNCIDISLSMTSTFNFPQTKNFCNICRSGWQGSMPDSLVIPDTFGNRCSTQLFEGFTI